MVGRSRPRDVCVPAARSLRQTSIDLSAVRPSARSFKPAEKAHGGIRGPFHTANNRKVRENTDAAR